ncbi:MAG: purine phosphoribosyltransferase family protein [Chloroflexota bacterium]
MRDYLRLIDTHTPGSRCDVTPLFADPKAFAALVEDLVQPFEGQQIDRVAGIDALGFILGTAAALRLGTGFLPIRKGGKLPVQAEQIEFVDYSGECKTLEMRLGSIQPGERILLVDDWIETGAQVQAAVTLIERQGGVIGGIAAINIDDNPGLCALMAQYFCHSVWLNMEER